LGRNRPNLLPTWNMPSDPVKAVFWFMYWLLQVLVHFFWLPILGMVAYETYINGSHYGIVNGIVGGFITLLVGLALWGALYVALLLCTAITSVSRTLSGVNRMRQSFGPGRRYSPFSEPEPEGPIVEGSIITDLEEERKRRRRE
jgi:hypothetical protein